MKFILTVTYQKCHPMEYSHECSDVLNSEWRDRQGAALLWIKQWFKTTGANRKYQSRGKGREVIPKSYAVGEVYMQLPVYGGEDFSEFYSINLAEGYRRVASTNRGMGLTSYHPEWGINVIDVYSYKRPEWRSLWLRVEDDDGNEYITDEAIEEEWV